MWLRPFFPRSNEKLNGAKGTKRDKLPGQKWRNLRKFAIFPFFIEKSS
jgi:hypothetical protein